MCYGFYRSVGYSYNLVYIWEYDPKVALSADEQYQKNRERDPGFHALKTASPAKVLMAA